MVTQDGVLGSSAIGDWSKAFGELRQRIGQRSCGSEARERVKRYLLGLLGRVERKNGWQMAEAIGERDPQGVQRLLNAAKWDADALRDDLKAEYIVPANGVLIRPVSLWDPSSRADCSLLGGIPVRPAGCKSPDLP